MDHNVSKRQKRLATLLRATSGTIRVDDAVEVLGLERAHARRLLAGWHKQGMIRRVAHGLYVPVPPSALGQPQVLEDPWILVPELYEPGYVGGWSALEHWELTEQLFRSVCVLTAKRVKSGKSRHQGVEFFIQQVPKRSVFGTNTLWRGKTKIQISDPHKTILDCIDDPALGAGLQHTLDCMHSYADRFRAPAERAKLLHYAERLDNGALYKKLGFLAEQLGFEKEFVGVCRNRITKGYAYLDKTAKNNRLITRWRLWVPRQMAQDDR